MKTNHDKARDFFFGTPKKPEPPEEPKLTPRQIYENYRDDHPCSCHTMRMPPCSSCENMPEEVCAALDAMAP